MSLTTRVKTTDYAHLPKSAAFSSGKFAELANNKTDFKFPRRKLDVNDYDNKFVSKIYKRYLAWYNAKKPIWKDRIDKVKR